MNGYINGRPRALALATAFPAWGGQKMRIAVRNPAGGTVFTQVDVEDWGRVALKNLTLRDGYACRP